MKKVLLGLAVLLTASNLTAGVVYAAVCQSTGGARMCGFFCFTNPGGNCQCEGTCTSSELKWVDGASTNAAVMEDLAN